MTIKYIFNADKLLNENEKVDKSVAKVIIWGEKDKN